MEKNEVIYEEIRGRITIDFKSECFGKKGIWALYGKNYNDLDYTCLNVGKSSDIGREILYDLGCLHYIAFRKNGTEKYVNQFNDDCGFNYVSGQTQEYLYPYIALRYYFIRFIFIDDDNDPKKEKAYAKEHNALFWRNGRPYGVKNKTQKQ